MPCSHPLFDVYNIGDFTFRLNNAVGNFLIGLGFLCAFQVRAEMLQQGNFLLQGLRVVKHGVFFADILTVNGTPLHIIEMEAVWVKCNLGRVIEEYSSSLVAKVVP
jgi:hypothetical protein